MGRSRVLIECPGRLSLLMHHKVIVMLSDLDPMELREVKTLTKVGLIPFIIVIAIVRAHLAAGSSTLTDIQ